MLSRVVQRCARFSITRDYNGNWCRVSNRNIGGRRISFSSLAQSFPSVSSLISERQLLEEVTCVRKFSSQPVEYLEATPEKSVEDQYSKKTPLQHVLLRPGMYVGPVERLPPSSCWVLDPTPKRFSFSAGQHKHSTEATERSFRMAQKEYGLIPALIKVFDEILVNASDNRLRHPETCSLLDVRIDPGAQDRDPCIRIWNNGKGIPIQVHKGEGMYGELELCSPTCTAIPQY
eukprot:scaffold2830_cov131-Cylindrotheca_fusiformis.AAC.79